MEELKRFMKEMASELGFLQKERGEGIFLSRGTVHVQKQYKKCLYKVQKYRLMEGVSGWDTVKIRFHNKALGLQVIEAIQEELNGQMCISGSSMKD